MKTIDQVSAEKLRGGFYTPDPLVEVCLDRIEDLMDGGNWRVLEPSAGDGAFLRGLGQSKLRVAAGSVTAIEVDVGEADKARAALDANSFDGEVLVRSAIEWAATSQREYDVTLGNPPWDASRY